MNPGEIVFSGALWVALLIALLAGLISFISPCVLPLVPGYLGFIGGTVSGGVEGRKPTRGRLLLGVGLFILGFTAVFVLVFVLGGTLGRLFIEYQDPITRILGIIVIAMGLVFVGVFGFAQRTLRPRFRENAGLVGAPLLGVAMGVGWAPCIGPTLTAILSISIVQADPWRAAVLALAYSAGLGLPFLVLAVGFGWATASVTFLKKHIRVLNIIGGVLLVVLGVLMITGIWTDIMARLQAVMLGVELPL